MARPKIKEPKQQYTVMLKPSVVKEIDEIAEKLEMSRSQMMSNLIDMGLDDAKIFNKLKVLDIVKLGSKLRSKMKRQYLNEASEMEKQN